MRLRLEQRRQRVVQTAGLEIGAAEADIRVGDFRSGLNDALELLDRFRALPKVEQGQAQIVPGLDERRVSLERLPVDLHRAARIPELPFRLAQQREKLRLARVLLQNGFQFLARPAGPAQIEIDVGQIKAGGNEIGIQRQRLPELRDRFTHEVR